MRAVLLSGLEEPSWSRRVRTFHALKFIFFFFFFFLLILTAFKGKTARHNRLASFGSKMRFLYGSFYRPFPHVRVSSATLKRAAQTPSGTPDLLCHPVRERMIYTSRPPTCGFEAAAPNGYHHLLLRPSPQGFWECLLKINLRGKGL